MKRLIIFDLDGTLVNIEPLFLKITNKLAPRFGYKPIALDELAKLKELPLSRFLWERLGWRIVFLPLLLKQGRDVYHQMSSEVELFPGIQELITALQAQGFKLGIVSSSREDTATALMQKFNLSLDFILHCSLFNKAEILRKTITQLQCPLDEVLYIGDEVRDVRACQKIGLDILAVTWGLNSKEALTAAGAKTVDTPLELLGQLQH
jgi:phosphoglycolate phosphatase-like HAD superfamily hydrolase